MSRPIFLTQAVPIIQKAHSENPGAILYGELHETSIPSKLHAKAVQAATTPTIIFSIELLAIQLLKPTNRLDYFFEELPPGPVSIRTQLASPLMAMISHDNHLRNHIRSTLPSPVHGPEGLSARSFVKSDVHVWIWYLNPAGQTHLKLRPTILNGLPLDLDHNSVNPAQDQLSLDFSVYYAIVQPIGHLV